MERLTKPNTVYCKDICDGAKACDGNHDPFDLQCAYAMVYDRLAAYEDLEEQGRLIVLPCKVGDTVYVFYTGRRNCKWPCNMKKGQIYEVTVSGMRLHDWSDDWSALLFFDTKEMTGDYEFSFDEFGKTIFQTRAEAEAAMKGVSEDA